MDIREAQRKHGEKLATTWHMPVPAAFQPEKAFEDQECGKPCHVKGN